MAKSTLYSRFMEAAQIQPGDISQSDMDTNGDLVGLINSFNESARRLAFAYMIIFDRAPHNPERAGRARIAISSILRFTAGIAVRGRSAEELKERFVQRLELLAVLADAVGQFNLKMGPEYIITDETITNNPELAEFFLWLQKRYKTYLETQNK